jgi:structural maintenance of chromosome 1
MLNSIEVFNFKSFRGKHNIGPFTSFTGVVGPNGGGKSNVVDAICFALLLPLIPNKVKHVRELVYRNLSEEADNEN